MDMLTYSSLLSFVFLMVWGNGFHLQYCDNSTRFTINTEQAADYPTR